MNALIQPSSLTGTIGAVSSKSMAQRLMILARLAPDACEVMCNTTSADIEATKRCLDALEAAWANKDVRQKDEGSEPIVLDCGESGATLRFLLPIVCAKGVSARFVRRGRLFERPLSPLDKQLMAHGVEFAHEGKDLLVRGRLEPGRFALPGDVSSQFVSGLLLAAAIMDEPTEIWVGTPVQSRPYVDLTIDALRQFGQDVTRTRVSFGDGSCERHAVKPTGLVSPASCIVEGDWSNAAFWLAAGTLEPEGVAVSGLSLMSVQGDRAILGALAAQGARISRRGDVAHATADCARAISLDVSAIPDLVPPIAAVAATAPGVSRLRNAGRLRLKESDRMESVTDAIRALGGEAYVEGDDVVVHGAEQLRGGTVDARGDHRIAMMAAVMATHAHDDVVVHGADCVSKSYPTFWEDYARLGGRVHLFDDEEA